MKFRCSLIMRRATYASTYPAIFLDLLDQKMSDRCGDYESYEYEDQKYEIIKTKILKKDDDEVRKKGFKTSRIKTEFDEETDAR